MTKSIVICLLILNSTFYIAAKPAATQITSADSLLKAGQYRQAAEAYEKLLADTPNHTHLLYSAAYAHLFTGRADIAYNYLRRLLARHGDSLPPQRAADIYNLTGLAVERVGSRDSAIFYYNKAIQHDKNYYEAYLNRGKAYYAAGYIDSAASDYEAAKKNPIIVPAAYYAAAELYYNKGQFSRAIANLEAVINQPTDDYRYAAMLGDAYYQQAPNDTTSLTKVIKYYSQALEMWPENVPLLNNRAAIYDKLEQYQLAEADREKIRAVQQKIGIKPADITYKILTRADSAFTITVPESWRLLTDSTTTNSDSSAIFLYDSLLFPGDVFKQDFIFEYAAEVKFYKNMFPNNNPTNNNLPEQVAATRRRDSTFSAATAATQQTNTETYRSYTELSRKKFNPNANVIREITKATVIAGFSNMPFFRIEYRGISTNGQMLSVAIWVPQQQAFYYEPLLDHIINTIQFPIK